MEDARIHSTVGDVLGMDNRHVVVCDYDERWPRLATMEIQRIMDACGDVIECIEHVGSTSVPGLPAKPILDLMPGLRRFEDGSAIVDAMTAMGYVYRGELGIAGRHFFFLDLPSQATTGSDKMLRVVHVHMFVVGCSEWRRHLAFRDHLRANPEDANDYAMLKKELAAANREDRHRYTDSKTDFIRGIDQRYMD